MAVARHRQYLSIGFYYLWIGSGGMESGGFSYLKKPPARDRYPSRKKGKGSANCHPRTRQQISRVGSLQLGFPNLDGYFLTPRIQPLGGFSILSFRLIPAIFRPLPL